MKQKLTTYIMTAIFALFTIAPIVSFAQDVGAPSTPVISEPVITTPAVADFPIPEGDIAAILLKLASDWKTLGTMGALVLILLLSVQAVKKFLPDTHKYKRLITLALSILYSILAGLVIPGSNWATVVVTVFISSGGAVALYEALKGAGIIKKA